MTDPHPATTELHAALAARPNTRGNLLEVRSVEQICEGTYGTCEHRAGRPDLVDGTYDFELPADSTAVALRITDMLGEEVLTVLPVARDA